MKLLNNIHGDTTKNIDMFHMKLKGIPLDFY